MVLKFSIEVAEDDIISIIKNAALDGKRGGLSVNVSYLILNPLGAQTTITTPTGTAPKSDGLFLVFTDSGTINLTVCHLFGSCCFKLGSLSLLHFQTLGKSNLRLNTTDW